MLLLFSKNLFLDCVKVTYQDFLYKISTGKDRLYKDLYNLLGSIR